MKSSSIVNIDGNEAAAYIAFKTSEVIAIYPITPSSGMGELADEWASYGQKNIWNTVPSVQEMQSEAGAAGAVHGSLQRGALTITFTASQGLLLMIPNMYKIAGELCPTVFHVAARSLATQALSIFGDHSDVMAVRQTGFAMLCSSTVQECMDLALVSHAATLEARIPFVHFFDGFRTSHEVVKIEKVSEEHIRAMIDEELVLAHRKRGLTPDNPVIRGITQNPDVYFQARETVNPFYEQCPSIVQKTMDKFAKLTGRQYHLYDYYGHPQAERVIVIMGSGAATAQETVEKLVESGEKVGVLKVRLYRPFAIDTFIKALPKTVTSIAVLDRTKEPGSGGEPLYMDVAQAIFENIATGHFVKTPKLVGGRYGLSSKEFTPAMVKAVYDELKKAAPKNHFTVGINDDVSHTSLEYDPNYIIELTDGVKAIFYGLGADGTVGANKNTIKIIGENTDLFVQGYFVYDSKKSGSQTVSHLRFGPKPIHSPFLVTRANFIGCHQFDFLEKYDLLENIEEGGVFLLNAPFDQDNIWDAIPQEVQKTIIDKKIRFYVIDAYKVARESKMGGRINTIMQTCFFAISGVLPREEAIKSIKDFIQKSYGKKGEHIVAMNFHAVDQSIANLHEVKYPHTITSKITLHKNIPDSAPDFVRNVISPMLSYKGDCLPVSSMPIDGTYPVGTAKWEKRNIAQEIPVWDESICIQCGKCSMVCPHSVIRFKVYEPDLANGAPSTFKVTQARDTEWKHLKYTLQVAPEDCTGCGLCVDVCPVKNKTEVKLKAINMAPQRPIREQEKENWNFFLNLPEIDRRLVKRTTIRSSQVLEPLFEFSGACTGCGETPYIKLATQLFGDRMLIANATGCSSIYGGNLPTTPYTKNKEGRGPAWANSLFEDNAEFGLGMRLAADKQKEQATELCIKLASQIGSDLVEKIINASQVEEADIFEQRERVAILKDKIKSIKSIDAQQLMTLADMLVKKSVWIFGGDGWAYDIGFGGLDHVLSSGRNVNVLVMDTEVYSNTGGQASKSTPRGAVAKFASAGKLLGKKNLARMMMTYGHVYVASVAMGAKDEHTLRTFLEAESYDGPSLIIAYSHCIAHGIDMINGLQEQKSAVATGYWPLFRYNPLLALEGKNPMLLDSADPKIPLKDFMDRENRFTMLMKSNPDEAKRLLTLAQQDVDQRWKIYKSMAAESSTEQQQG
ncbi:MAG: pyruvate:ferredoxin (flavodoxin) oxidoreductase [Candidatus Omnitrophica bacterium]|nr:pyruvate:ferredoxin (flavodoxin) oxidoreductase [Candidatus Omnitrophota bacterium]